MVITSKNNTELHHYGNTQIRLSLVYILMTLLVLMFLNFYCSRTCREAIFRSKEEALLDKCLIAAKEIAQLKTMSEDTLEPVADKLSGIKISRILITDENGLVLYDSSFGQSHVGTVFQKDSIHLGLQGNDVIYWTYDNGTTFSEVAVPVYRYEQLLGCIYIIERDPDQGQLIQSLQNIILFLTVVLEIAVIFFTLVFSKMFSRRIRRIFNSIRLIRSGDYNHKVQMGGNDELTMLGEEFNDLTDKLQNSERKRHQFVSDASHELKTPLASIKLLTDSILQNPMDSKTINEFVADIGNEADRLTRMTQKLLSITKMDDPYEPPSEIIYMGPTLKKVIRMLDPLAHQESITINLDDRNDSPILVLEDDLYQIAFNLVENGIKYNVPGGSLDIRFMRQNDNAILEVTDTGVGIEEDALEHIFERFYRVDKARSRKSGGSGLGLSIVRNMVERNSGQILVTSKPGFGTCFQVIFPIFDTDMP